MGRALILGSILLVAAAAASAPDIIFVLADDLGFNEVGFQNASRGLVTPELDRLAREGVILTQYYVQPICSPTRSALMTGRYTGRLGTQSNVIYWDTPWGVALEETFLAENLKDAGYETAIFGKWHLGMFREAYLPTRRGFDAYAGYLQGCESAWTHVSACCAANSSTSDETWTCQNGSARFDGYDWWAGTAPDASVVGDKSVDVVRARAEAFLRGRGAAPYFLYLPFQNIHMPYTTKPEFRALYEAMALTENEKTVWGYVSELDDAVGAVAAAAEATGRFDDAVFVFSSDNGAPPHDGLDHGGEWSARNFPFRGHKAQLWEGGVRVPAFVRCPKRLRPGRSDALVHVTDWLPTLVGVAGGSTARNRPLDGRDVWAALAGSAPSPRVEVVLGLSPLCGSGQAQSPKAALRRGSLKLAAFCYDVKGVDGATATGPRPGANMSAVFDSRGLALFDVLADPGETTNLLPHPAATALLAALEAYANASVEPMQWDAPYQGAAYACADCPRHPPSAGPFAPWGPWL